jgi:hypothetical protein
MRQRYNQILPFLITTTNNNFKVEVELSEEEVHAASEKKHLSESYAHFSEYIIGKEKSKFENIATNEKRRGNKNVMIKLM